jgi:hypothetical protein
MTASGYDDHDDGDSFLARGKRVIYRAAPDTMPEEGTVTGTSASGFVFVLFDGDTAAKACRPQDLEEWL